MDMEVWLKSSVSMAQQLLVSEIHATFIESGFMGYTETPIDDKSDSCHCCTSSYYYTLPALVANNNDGTQPPPPPPPLVQVEFQASGNLLTACGHLVRKDSNMHSLCLDKSGELAAAINRGDLSELRRKIKDGMCFPLLINISEEAGLTGPSSLSTLPDELKIVIMTMVPGTTLAVMECVCGSLRSLSSSRDYQLWATKFRQEFGDREVPFRPFEAPNWNWKERFIYIARDRKRRRDDEMSRMGEVRRRFLALRMRRPSN
ncbi:unnamed protein product [Linum tenue]|uniref:F-box domain-containing protein n=1 Tax=Linum tenue TaxID=586396 RepID=A0AAV0PM22_9ROSI|nr:unnamed protein product [Linum tenue]